MNQSEWAKSSSGESSPGATSSRPNPHFGPSRGRLMQPLASAEEAAIWKSLKSSILPVLPISDCQKPFVPTFGVELECLVRFDPADLMPAILDITSIGDRDMTIQSMCASRDRKLEIRQDIAQTLRQAGVLVNDVEVEKDNAKWTIATDDSIDCGVEIANDAGMHGWIGVEIKTPACNFHQQSLQHVFSVIKLLTSKYAITTNQSCGLHVHVGTRSTKGESTIPLRTYKNLAMLMPSHRRDYNGEVLQLFNPGTRSVNFQNLDPSEVLRARMGHGGQTIEFRQHEGCMDARRVVKWVQLCVGLVHWAHQEVGIQPLMSSTFGFPQIGERGKRVKQGFEIGLADVLRVLNVDPRVVEYFSTNLHSHEAPDGAQEAKKKLSDQASEHGRTQAARKALDRRLFNASNELCSSEVPNDSHDAEEELSDQLAEQGHLQAERAALDATLLSNTKDALDRIADAELESSLLTKWKLNTITLRDYQTLATLHAQHAERKKRFRRIDPDATPPWHAQPSDEHLRSRGLEASRLKVAKWCADGGWGPIKGRPVTADEWEVQMNALWEVEGRKRKAAHAVRREGEEEGEAEDETTEAKLAFRSKINIWEAKVLRAGK